MSLSSQFVKHEPCPKCGSKDNLGRYSDGHAYCFGCRYSEQPTNTDIFRDLRHESQISEKVKTFQGNSLTMPPDDALPFIGVPGLKWLNKYDIIEAERKEFLWSESKQWLIYPLWSARALRDRGEKVLVAWQARNFNIERPKPRYLTRGPIGSVFHIIGNPSGPIVYIVEDIISALKVGRSYSALCLFGSQLALPLLTSLTTRFKALGVWLDMDKCQEAVTLAQRARGIGFKTTPVIITDKDPKEYTDQEIKEHIENAT